MLQKFVEKDSGLVINVLDVDKEDIGTDDSMKAILLSLQFEQVDIY